MYLLWRGGCESEFFVTVVWLFTGVQSLDFEYDKNRLSFVS